MLGGALANRIHTIQLILDGAPVDSRRASERLAYELARRHTALVLWTPTSSETQGVFGIGGHHCGASCRRATTLTLSAGVSALWAWIGSDAELETGAMSSAMSRVDPGVRVAAGPTKAGIAGFRSSHLAALSIQNLLAERPGGARLAFHHDLEVAVLAANDMSRASEFVATTLGALAADTPGAARLRETLRIFLDEADNAPRAAARLNTHRNTILQRVFPCRRITWPRSRPASAGRRTCPRTRPSHRPQAPDPPIVVTRRRLRLAGIFWPTPRPPPSFRRTAGALCTSGHQRASRMVQDSLDE